ncbi:Eco57I restriction-modification methylase domain-containing protein, partial [Thiospirillum jenense]
ADQEIRVDWLDYASHFPHQSAWFRAAPQFSFQSAVVNGKKTGSDINLYKLFTEQCVNLLRPGGECGIVIPSGIYTDLGAKGLRDLLFGQCDVTGLFCFENRNEIFENVHRSFKFVVLTFEKGQSTRQFPAAFMRHQVNELAAFPSSTDLLLSVELIRRLSPDSQSVMEFKSALDVQIAEKLLQFPLLGETIDGKWNLRLTNEFHMTNDSHLFKTAAGAGRLLWNLRLTREFDMTNDNYLFKTAAGVGRLPLFEGKMIHQFTHQWAPPRYWLDEQEARADLIGRGEDSGQQLAYQNYRLGFRAVAANTNERSLISTLLPNLAFAGNSLIVSTQPNDANILLFLVALMNSFVIDSSIRQKVSQNLNMFYIYQIPIPRLTAADPVFNPIVTRAAQLICTTPEFDSLAEAVGLHSHRDGVIDSTKRVALRAELDGLIAHLYGLTELEFAHILSTFPLVAEEIKTAAMGAYRAGMVN